jgi:FkbM family methyltransferase
MLKRLKGYAISICPPALLLPLKYKWRKLTGQLEQEIFWMQSLIEPGGRAIDVGANEGIYSYVLSQICHVVEAFEPQSGPRSILAAYSQVSQAKVNIHPVCLSEANGSAMLHIPIDNGRNLVYRASLRQPGGDYETLTVGVRKLDDYKFERVSLIKIDVEGHEIEVIRGGLETIQRNQPILLVEVEQRWLGGKPIESVFAELETLGYTGFFLEQSVWRRVDDFSSDRHQNPSHLERSKVRRRAQTKHQDYVNNFLFLPKCSALRQKLLNCTVFRPQIKNRFCVGDLVRG